MENRIDIEIRRDGVYLSIHRPPGNPVVSRTAVFAEIESYGVKDVDFLKLNEALNAQYEYLEFKLSSNTRVTQVNESALVEISKDRMEAFITFSQPVNNGRAMPLSDVLALVKKAGVVLNQPEKLTALLRQKRPNRQYTIAAGQAPIKGADGFLRYHFDNSNLRPKPKILEDGSVDFKDLSLFRLCERGDILVTDRKSVV